MWFVFSDERWTFVSSSQAVDKSGVGRAEMSCGVLSVGVGASVEGVRGV